MNGPTRAQILLWWGILAMLLALALLDYGSFQIGAYKDDARYLVLSRSLFEAPSYGMMNEPGAPGPTWYPFGYPLLLSPVARLFPPHANAVKLLSLLATIANASLLFWGWRSFSRTASYGWSLAVVALHATSPLVVEHARMVMSEPVFLTSCLLTMILADRAARGKDGRRWSVAMGAALTLTVFVRTVGVAIAVAALAWVAWSRGLPIARRLASAVGVSILLTAACVAATSLEPESLVPTRYVGWAALEGNDAAASLATRMVSAARTYGGRHLADLVFQSPRPALGLLALAAIVLGFLSWWRSEGPSLVLVTTLAYGVVLLGWPYHVLRFLYPVQPWLALLLLRGSGAPFRRELRSLPRGVAAATAVLAALGIVACVGIRDTRYGLGDLEDATAWLRANAPADAVVLSENPETDFLYGARKTVPLPGEWIDASLAAYLRERRVTHVVVSPELRLREPFHPEWSERGRLVAASLDRMVEAGAARVVHDEAAAGVRVYALGR